MGFTIRLPKVILPMTFETSTKRRVIIKIYYSQYCPHCRKIVDVEKGELKTDTPLYQAIEEAKATGEVEIEVRLINVDTPEGSALADEVGIEYIPAVFINGVQISVKYLHDKNKMLAILLGREPPEEDDTGFTKRLSRMLSALNYRRWW